MSVKTFDSHLAEVGARLQELRESSSGLALLLERHNHNGYSTLDSVDFDGRQVTKGQYDAAMVSITNLIDTWLPGGHGTNIDTYLYETPS
jgi:hypothetical protein